MAREKKKSSIEGFRARMYVYCNQLDVDPHEFMADIIATPGVDVALKLKAAEALASYLQPKLKAMEISGSAEQPVRTIVEMVDYRGTDPTDTDSPSV